MKEIFRNNVLILFFDLEKAVKKYLATAGGQGGMEYINAYLAATLNSIIEFTDRFMQEDEEILACKGANNALKHDVTLDTHTEPEYGFTLPAPFPIKVFPIEIVWKNTQIKCKKPAQREAYKNLFAGKSMLKTLQSMVDRIKAN